jgi:hypothetical protein
LDRQLAALEVEAAELAAAKPVRVYHADRLRGELEGMLHPVIVRDIPEVERKFLWPWWQLLRILSDYTNSIFPQLEYVAGDVANAVADWWNELLDAARDRRDAGEDPEADEPDGMPSWNPINVVTLHDLKFRLRIDHHFDEPGREPGICDVRNNRHLGIEKAEQIDHLLGMGHGSPWSRNFDANPDHWPADTRTEILRRLEASQSLVPDHVPPFDWAEVRIYQYWHPFPRSPDGKPLPQVFADEDKVDAGDQTATPLGRE